MHAPFVPRCDQRESTIADVEARICVPHARARRCASDPTLSPLISSTGTAEPTVAKPMDGKAGDQTWGEPKLRPPLTTMSQVTRLSRLAYAYICAKEHVIQQGFKSELEWQSTRSLDQVSESDFLRESAWVVLSSGMREAVVRNIFPKISAAFRSWNSATDIVACREDCVLAALGHFNHKKKIEAIADIATRVDASGFSALKHELCTQGVEFLRRLPFIGPITSYHLAKNLGFDVVKADRHLVRIARAFKFDCPERLCKEISWIVGDRLAIIDIVLWRFATIVPNYVQVMVSPRTR